MIGIKFMKKRIIPFILLLFIIYNLIGYMAAFQVIRSEWRLSVRAELAKIAKDNLVKFVFSKNNFDTNQTEFEYKNQYYDICSITIHGDSVEIMAFEDATETRLIEQFKNIIINNNTQNRDYQDKTQFYFDNLLKNYIFDNSFHLKHTPSVSHPFSANYVYVEPFFPPNYIWLLSPPPEFHLCA